MEGSGSGASTPTRRSVLNFAGSAVLLAASTAACDLLSTKPSAQGAEGADGRQNPAGTAPTAVKEAPDLAHKVRTGSLPPLRERLPVKPLVIEPTERIGTYGGTWHTGFLGPANSYWVNYTAGYEGLVRWDVQWQKVIPNVAESFEASPDGREFTFVLREGMKWSDGEPFTTADIEFSFEDGILDQQLFPLPMSFLTSGDGTPARLNVEDDRTFRVVFDEPSGLFLERLASQSYGTIFGDTAAYPRHYLEKSHPKYNPAVEEEARRLKYTAWTDLFFAQASYTSNPELPTLNAWRVTTPLGTSGRVIAERNPYYWKVDPDGKQLPYIDAIQYDVSSDVNAMLLKVTSGEYEFHFPGINTLENKPVIARSKDTCDCRVFDMTFTRMNWMVIALNLAHRDPVKREIFQNRDFRIGLSYAIDRPKLINAVFQRTGKPWQAAPRQESEFYDEELATQYTAYDLDQANSHLDAAGYRRDGDGARLGPDGAPISFFVDVATTDTQAIDALEIVRADWGRIGVGIEIRALERSLFYTRKEANQHDANVWGGDGGLKDAMLDPRWYFPSSSESNYAIPWATWFLSRGRNGERPPAPAQRQMELYWQLLSEPEENARKELFEQILQIAKEEFYVIGTVLPLSVYGVKTTNFHNAPEPMILSYLHPDPGPDRPEQFFIS
ncbi:ABC transporter substrate-binding protein [Actinopolymorpha pittospori]|uniref:Peptide/nickel transport system substrate-binding protein n=1 Tax=Actinopolymorpha pittospori TaxID=648752 RepID=A0A927MVA8_9ACTN|nr:peptide/nickel transport system substrate-binding protein [Actinopolymorpha pittospori]